MTEDSELFWFGVVLTLVLISVLFNLVGTGTKAPRASIQPIAPDAIADTRLADLQQQCQRLRTALQQQQAQLHTDFQDNTFAQLQPLLTSYPSARKMAESKPDLPAHNLTALFTPLENLLQTWQIDAIGAPWEQLPFNPQHHQPDADDIAAGEPVYIRFVGYAHGDRILSPAKVSRTLPGGASEGA